MEIPKEITDKVCSHCEMWKIMSINGKKIKYCASYARECDDLANALYGRIKGGKYGKKYNNLYSQYAMFRNTGKLTGWRELTSYVMEAKDTLCRADPKVSADTICAMLDDKGHLAPNLMREIRKKGRKFFIGSPNYAVVNKDLISGFLPCPNVKGLSEKDVRDLAEKYANLFEGRGYIPIFKKIRGKGHIAKSTLTDVLYHYMNFYGRK